MNCYFFKKLILSAVISGAAYTYATDDLDAAFAEQKKKVKRRVYSERAVLDDLHLLVPETPSKAEMALDKDLRQLENQLNKSSLPAIQTTMRRPMRPAPVRPENWLTPDLLNPQTGNVSSEKDEKDWVQDEFERRNTLKKQKEALAKEEAMVNKMLKEDSRQSFKTDSSPLRSYESKLRNSLSTTSSSSTPQTGTRDPLRSHRKKEVDQRGRFSPTARSNSGVIKSSFSSSRSSNPRTSLASRRPAMSPQLNRPRKKTPSNLSWDWEKQKKETLSPLKRVRRASSIHRKDPFSDDFTPSLRTSIWD